MGSLPVIPSVAADLEKTYPLLIGSEERAGAEVFEDRSPVDTRIIVGRFQVASPEDVKDAFSTGYAAWRGWRRTPWQDRVAILERAAAILRERRSTLADLLSIEIGKTADEAEYDINETADVISYYCRQMREADGFSLRFGGVGTDRATDVLKSYGVWLVISPFNFPMALAGGPASAALVAGNTVVMKPSSEAPAMAFAFAAALREAGLPDGALSVVTGPGSLITRALIDAGLAGISFTGSYLVGQRLRTVFAPLGIPVIAEMGGKNPSIVTRSADIGVAAEGVARSAFSFSGQKCSANSRVYVERHAYSDFLPALVQRARQIVVGDPRIPTTTVGPVINAAAVTRYTRAVAAAKRGGLVEFGAQPERDLPDHGTYVRPMIATDLTLDHRLFRDELFLPIVAVAPVESLSEALRLANDSVFGLTAGIYAQREAEIQEFLTEIEAGLVYVNRRTGATTGARVGAQTFGGWKGSGSSGANAYGPYYLFQFMREQNQTFGT